MQLAAFSEQWVGLDEIREELGAELASELFEKGQNMSRRQAVRFALDSAPK
ncbi:MAG TPA: hypothetical protein VFP42_10735 [Acidimicrobiia bacterium]|nr:hypothetical protein [Acidimicrobiia bacterium]